MHDPVHLNRSDGKSRADRVGTTRRSHGRCCTAWTPGLQTWACGSPLVRSNRRPARGDVSGSNAAAGMQAVAEAPELGGNGAFQAIKLPSSGTKVVLLPRWNIIALAQRPVALSVRDVAEVPEIAASQPVQRVRSTPVCSSALLGSGTTVLH